MLGERRNECSGGAHDERFGVRETVQHERPRAVDGVEERGLRQDRDGAREEEEDPRTHGGRAVCEEVDRTGDDLCRQSLGRRRGGFCERIVARPRPWLCYGWCAAVGGVFCVPFFAVLLRPRLTWIRFVAERSRAPGALGVVIAVATVLSPPREPCDEVVHATSVIRDA